MAKRASFSWMMHVGVSGWSFPEWKDTFYEGVPRSRWLERYAGILSTVEVNYTFHRTMAESTAEKWRRTAGAGFRFAIKAHQRITHHSRLANPEDSLAHFLDALPTEIDTAFEFRNPSWFDPTVYGLLESAGAALVIAETDEEPASETITAPFTYLRLRKSDYSSAEIDAWANKISAYGVDAWVYFKHESTSTTYARLLQQRLG